MPRCDPYTKAEREANMAAMLAWLDRALSGQDAGPKVELLPPVCGPYGPALTEAAVRWGIGDDGQTAVAYLRREDCAACEGSGSYVVPGAWPDLPEWPYHTEACECAELAEACRAYSVAGMPALAGVPGLSLTPIDDDRVRGFDWRLIDDGARGARVARQIRAWRDAVVTSGAGPLVLAGPTGVGKTHIAQGLLRDAAFGLRRRPAWVRWRRYLDACRHGVAREYAAAGFLVVDELSGAGREWGATELEDLLDERQSARRPTVITTNLDGDDLRAAVGDRAFSRLVGHGVVVEVPGRDYRLTRGRP